MSIAIAQPKFCLGVKSDVSSNIAYHDERTLVYPAGNLCVTYNVDQGVQKFINGSEKNKGFTAMAVSPNRRYVALAEKTMERPTITIYDITTQKKKKVLQSAEIQAESYISLQFSPDSKYLCCQTGKPDYLLLLWTWEKARVMATKNTSPQGGELYQVSFNPYDSNLCISVVGEGVVRAYNYSHTEAALKQKFSTRAEGVTVVSHCWLSLDKVACGTDDGYLQIYDQGELKLQVDVMDDALRNKEDRKREKSKQKRKGSAPDSYKLRDRFNIDKKRKRMSLIGGPTSSPPNTAEEIQKANERGVWQILNSNRGLLCATGNGRVALLEKIEEGTPKETYKRTKVFLTKKPSADDILDSEVEVVKSMALSPSEDTLCASTNLHQLYHVSMTAVDNLSREDSAEGGDIGYFETVYSTQQPMTTVPKIFHSAAVTGVDICVRKPLIATCSLDKSVRIWNYERNHLEIYKEFQEEAHSIALHPSGLYCLVGFADKLRLMNILIDDIRTFKDLPLRACKECAFSHGGHLFAAVQNNVIQVYSSTTYENVFSLSGHNGRVRSVVWSQDDTRLVSCGVDGAVYEWDIILKKRVSEVVLKACQYTGVAVAGDGKTVYAVGNDRTVKEISESQILRSVETEDMVYSHIAMSNSGRMLFVGCMNGAMRCLKFPLQVPGEWNEHSCHNAKIVNMKVTCDDQCLVTISDDSTVVFWKIQDKEGRGLKRDKEIGWAEEILITKSDLEEKNQIMHDLRQRVEELRNENEYQLRLKEMNYKERTKELTEKYIQEMEQLKTKNQVMKTEKDKMEAKHEEDMSELQEKSERDKLEMEQASNQKLMLEYEKYQELQHKSQKQQEDYEQQIQKMEESKEEAIEALTEQFDARYTQLQYQFEQAKDLTRQQQKEYEEIRCQIEEDGDREILDLKTKYEHKLREERDANTRLRGETGIMQKKSKSLQKEIEELKEEIKKGQNEEAKLNNMIKALQKDIDNLKKEIQERDETIQDKEKRIYDLKKKNQELEKFKFVLDYKIKELKKQIEPKEDEVRRQKEQIQEMESELERFHKNNTQLELNISELKQKLKAAEKEMQKERQRSHDLLNQIKRFKTDLHNCVGYIQEPAALKNNIKQLYEKHVQKDDIGAEATIDSDIQKEYARQREHLEKTVQSLRKKLAKDGELHKADNVRIMQENVTLIKEINDLRKELKICRTNVHDLEAALGLHRKNNSDAVALVAAMQTQNKNALMEETIREKSKVVEMQQSEIRRLRLTLQTLEQAGSRAVSAELPPL